MDKEIQCNSYNLARDVPKKKKKKRKKHFGDEVRPIELTIYIEKVLQPGMHDKLKTLSFRLERSFSQ